MSKLCVLVKWSPHNFHHLFCIFHTRPSSIILGKREQGVGQGIEGSRVLPLAQTRNKGLSLHRWVREPKAKRITRPIHTPPRVWPQEKALTLKHEENDLAGFHPLLGGWPLMTDDGGPVVIQWCGRK